MILPEFISGILPNLPAFPQKFLLKSLPNFFFQDYSRNCFRIIFFRDHPGVAFRTSLEITSESLATVLSGIPIEFSSGTPSVIYPCMYCYKNYIQDPSMSFFASGVPSGIYPGFFFLDSSSNFFQRSLTRYFHEMLLGFL